MEEFKCNDCQDGKLYPKSGRGKNSHSNHIEDFPTDINNLPDNLEIESFHDILPEQLEGFLEIAKCTWYCPNPDCDNSKLKFKANN